MGSSTGRVCKAETKDGRPCASYAVEGSVFCFWHDPSRASERKEARARGGRARHGRTLDGSDAEPVALSSLADVCKLLEQTASDLLGLENSIQRARALTYVCATATRALQVADLEERILRLEARYAIANGEEL